MPFILCSLLLSVQLISNPMVANAKYQNITYSTTTEDTTITSTQTNTITVDGDATYGNRTVAQTYLTPTAFGATYTWTQVYTPAILGTVFVVVDGSTTKTSTSIDRSALASGSNTQYLVNGTLSLLRRTDVNEEGTVTTTFPTPGGFTTIAYPTPYFEASETIDYYGLFPTATDAKQASCCQYSTTYAATPKNHYAFPSSTGSTNPADPTGWLYSITSSEIVYLGSTSVSSLFAPAMIQSVLQFCPYEMCNTTVTEVSPIQNANTVAALLSTTTVSVTPAASTPASPAATSRQNQETSGPSPSAIPAEPQELPQQSQETSGVSTRVTSAAPDSTLDVGTVVPPEALTPTSQQTEETAQEPTTPAQTLGSAPTMSSGITLSTQMGMHTTVTMTLPARSIATGTVTSRTDTNFAGSPLSSPDQTSTVAVSSTSNGNPADDSALRSDRSVQSSTTGNGIAPFILSGLGSPETTSAGLSSPSPSTQQMSAGTQRTSAMSSATSDAETVLTASSAQTASSLRSSGTGSNAGQTMVGAGRMVLVCPWILLAVTVVVLVVA